MEPLHQEIEIEETKKLSYTHIDKLSILYNVRRIIYNDDITIMNYLIEHVFNDVYNFSLQTEMNDIKMFMECIKNKLLLIDDYDILVPISNDMKRILNDCNKK